MKITKIFLKDFHQFKDLTIDLTYPKGHEKQGLALDKVCLIGQSGTGKTSLLELIPKFLYRYNTKLVQKSGMLPIIDRVFVSVEFGIENEYSVEFSYDKKAKNNSVRPSQRIWNNPSHFKLPISSDDAKTYYIDHWIKDIATKLIYFPANLNYDLEFVNETQIDKPIMDFSEEKVASVWNLILDTVQAYQEGELHIRQEISKTVEQSSNDLEVIKKALQKLEEWKKKEFNPIEDIADNCLNTLLAPFKLRVKTELDIKSKEDLGFIKIEDFSGNEIPNGLWSTGTKQVVLSVMPLYLLKPKHTVILFDEPERSLYPDLQRFIIDFYSSLAENCQFFYSTHSPIIASSFEPWEIVELKFDKEGHVYRELYYEGENHVNNYKYNPQYMRWDDILQRIFDMENDGSPLRKEKLDELATYNVKYKKLEKQDKADSDEGKTILSNIQQL